MILTLVATAASALGAASTASAASADVQQASSGNWAGYVAGSSSGTSETRFRSVSGSWVAPTATCTSSGDGSAAAYSAFWVGLGGAGQTEALEQAGTEANCSPSGTADYYAWYELVPAAPVRVDLAVHPGDHISSRVTVEGSAVDVSVSNKTTGQSFSKQLTMGNPDVSSAEWIAEAPSSCDGTVSSCSPLPLANFGTISFTSASATTAGGHTGSLSDSAWSTAELSLTPGADSAGFQGVAETAGEGTATPSSLSSDGSSFSVAYSASDAATSMTTGGQGYGGDYYDGNPGYGYGGGAYGYGGGYGGSDYGYGYGSDGWSGDYPLG